MKVCSLCLAPKPLDAFYGMKVTKDGLSRRCKPCVRAQAKRYRDANPEAQKEKKRLEWARHGKRYAAQRREEYRRNPQKWILHEKKRRYGLTPERYLGMLASQAGACACCGRTDRKLVVDHDHVTKRVRSLLCSNCNSALGLCSESPNILERLIAYIVTHSSSVDPVQMDCPL